MKLVLLGLLVCMASAHAEEAASSKPDPEQDAMDEICGLVEETYNAQKAIDREQAIGKVSGAVNLSRLNELGRMVVRRREELMPLVEAYEKTYKGKPDLDGRCIFAQSFDKAEWARLKKKAGRQKKVTKKKGKG